MKKYLAIVLLFAFALRSNAQQNNTDEGNWLYYDDGQYVDCIGVGGYLYWAVMFPSSVLQNYAGYQFSKVALYEVSANTKEIEMGIYLGGDDAPGNLVYKERVVPLGEDGFLDIELDSIIEIDGNDNLWIVFYQIPGYFDLYPATVSNDITDDPNGRWVSVNPYSWAWMDLADAGLPGYTWMIRGYVTDYLGVEKPLTNEISIFPNPAQNIVTIQGMEVFEVLVYDTFGKLIQNHRNTNTFIVANLSKGLYLLHIIDQYGQAKTEKLIVK